MALIHVLEVPAGARDPKRPVSSLLKMQIEHLHQAEQRLPPRYRTDIYVNAIKNEAEAARYIREVTDAIHTAHGDAAHARQVPARKRFQIAAAAEKTKSTRVGNVAKKKSIRGTKPRRKK